MSKLSERRNEIRQMTEQQAQEELARLRRELFDLRLQLKRGEVKNNRQFAQDRTDIARLLNHLTELRQAAELEAAGALETQAGEKE
ncbi:MAG TPA: 50S ribosomal protein L29 [Ktedonobacterales bacterium]